MATPVRLPTTVILLLTAAIVAAGCVSSANAGSSRSTSPRASAPRTESSRAAGRRIDREPWRAERAIPPAASVERDEPSAEDRELTRALAGEWRLAENDAEARIDRAVAEVTGQMNVFVRSIANGRIDESVNPDQRVMIEADGADHVVVAIGRGRPVRLALNGPYVRTTSADGQPLRVRAIVRGDRLSIQERTDQGSRLLTLQPRGDGLVMTTRIHSDRLPADIVYGLDYRRTSGGAIARR